MGNRFYSQRLKDCNAKFTQTWGRKAGNGRWMKRILSKARRRAWKDSHERGLVGIESECNWKGW